MGVGVIKDLKLKLMDLHDSYKLGGAGNSNTQESMKRNSKIFFIFQHTAGRASDDQMVLTDDPGSGQSLTT